MPTTEGTIAEMMLEVGYRTMKVGKTHMNNGPKADAMKRRGEAPKTFPSVTRAIDGRSGKVLWLYLAIYHSQKMNLILHGCK